jgi:hypothetical protein
MKLNKKKISALLGVGLISALSITPTLNTEAALTSPSFTFAYAKGSLVYQLYQNSYFNSIGSPTYTRSGTSPNYDYVSQFDDTDFYGLPVGMSITLTFNQSTTSWWNPTASVYIPESSNIGSNVNGFIFDKVRIKIDNQTQKDYLFYFDISSMNGNLQALVYLNGQLYWSLYDAVNFNGADGFLERLVVPAYSTLELRSHGSNQTNVLLDAFYLTDIGTANAYAEGYDLGLFDGEYGAGYEAGFEAGFDSINAPNTLLMGFQAMIGILVNFALMILNLNVFGVSLLNIFGILALFVGLIWILKIVRG